MAENKKRRYALGMIRKPAPKPDDPKQSKRFIEMAREIGVDESADAFEHAFKKIVPVKRVTPKPSSQGES